MKRTTITIIAALLALCSYAQSPTYSTVKLTHVADQIRFEVPNENRYWFMSKTASDNKAFALYSPEDGGWFTYWKEASGDMIVNRGKVGIGTANPSNLVDLEKNFNGSSFLEVTNSNTGNLARRGIIMGDGNSGRALAMFSTSENYNAVTSWQNSGVISTDSQLLNGLVLRTSSGNIRFQPNGTIDKMTIKSDGNVGIGTTNPSSKLEIFNSSVATLGDNNATTSMVFSGTNNWKGMVWTDQSGNGRKALRYNHQDGYLAFSDFSAAGHNNDRLVIDGNGNVGIGTTSPFSKFDVIDTKNSSEHLMTVRNHTVSTNSSSGIALINSTASGSIAGARLISKRRTSGVDVDFNVQLYDGAIMNQRLTILGSSGNVGIGTTNPDSRLTVNGGIHSQEIIVDVEAGTGPDYVFEEDYNLISLEETKAYIETNKHLPEVPSAKVMESEGVELRDMSLLLLKKIEEMTLHQIQLMEEVKALKAKVKELEK
ncbi:MAG: hypothetical protein AAFQ94_07605 [Bacteroidota bacterium]